MNYDYGNIRIQDGFWKNYKDLNRNTTIRAVWDRFKETGRIDAFNFNWKPRMENQPHIYWDSDVFKWLEGACNIIAEESDNDLKEKIEYIVSRIEKNQSEDGYFNIYYTVCEEGKRFTHRAMHELYCAGHLFEAAVAYYNATGSNRLIDVARNYALCIENIFIKENSASFITPGHQEIEIALAKLYKVTGEELFLKLAEFFVLKRGNNEKDMPIDGESETAQDYATAEAFDTAKGHAVRCLYMLSGMADVGELTNNEKILKSCENTYRDIVDKKMYITGGTGSTSIGEAFTIPYDLPSETAYSETCASIALMLFADRMCRIYKDAQYADTVEKAMYNGMLSGISLDGTAFFYENPLEINLDKREKSSVKLGKERLPIIQRKVVFDCSCCPPNLNRTLSSMEKFIYHIEGKECYINQFISSTLTSDEIEIVQKTNYPWNGRVEIQTKGADRLHIRIPGWCDDFKVNCDYTIKNGYAVIESEYVTSVTIDMNITPFLVEADPRVSDISGKAAVQCGPLIYCAEGMDNGENLNAIYIVSTDEATVEYDPFFRGNTITVPGLKAVHIGGLYTKRQDCFEEIKIKLIPYYGFANRGESNMKVWLNYKGGII